MYREESPTQCIIDQQMPMRSIEGYQTAFPCIQPVGGTNTWWSGPVSPLQTGEVFLAFWLLIKKLLRKWLRKHSSLKSLQMANLRVMSSFREREKKSYLIGLCWPSNLSMNFKKVWCELCSLQKPKAVISSTETTMYSTRPWGTHQPFDILDSTFYFTI